MSTDHPSPTDQPSSTVLTPAPGSTAARRARTAVAGLVIATSLLGAGALSACSDSDADASPPATVASAAVRPVVVRASDYHFDGVPETVPAGTRLELVNDSNVELHELVAIRVADGDTRSVEELLSDPALESTMPATVLLATPGGDEIPAVGDGTLTEPGRYVLVCAIPTGISPQAYLDAVAAAGGQKPQIPGAAEPHLAHGMFTELVVE